MNEELREFAYQCILEMDAIQTVGCGGEMCSSARGKELVNRGMDLLAVLDLSGETLATTKRGYQAARKPRKPFPVWRQWLGVVGLFRRIVFRLGPDGSRVGISLAWNVAKVVCLD